MNHGEQYQNQIIKKTNSTPTQPFLASPLPLLNQSTSINSLFNQHTILTQNMESHLLTKRQDQSQKEIKLRSIKHYLQHRIMPVLAPLQISILRQKPIDVASFCIDYLKQTKSTELNVTGVKEIENQDVPEGVFREMVREKIRNQRKGSRRGIIGDRPKEGFLTIGNMYLASPGTDYSQQVIVNLMMYLKKCMFFEHLQPNQLIKLIQRMKTVDFQSGEVIIKQGEGGNELFIVESGTLKCQKQSNEKDVKYYNKGEIFGQLSLLYNNPRARTVTAIASGRLFSLSRSYFSAIMHLGMIDKLKECESLVQKIDLFDSLNIYQRTKLYESMQLKTVGAEKYIIREGEQGTCFYIVAEGELVAYKQRNGQNKLVYAYKRGDYFGEIALLRNLPRQASVKTITDVRLYFINAESFSRVLGPLELIIRRNQERYSRWTSQIPE